MTKSRQRSKDRTFIVKFQLPLTSNSPSDYALVYDKSHSFMNEIPIDKVIRDIIIKQNGKAYFRCKFAGTLLEIIALVDYQDW